jgi:hypothetical protein
MTLRTDERRTVSGDDFLFLRWLHCARWDNHQMCAHPEKENQILENERSVDMQIGRPDPMEGFAGGESVDGFTVRKMKFATRRVVNKQMTRQQKIAFHSPCFEAEECSQTKFIWSPKKNWSTILTLNIGLE